MICQGGLLGPYEMGPGFPPIQHQCLIDLAQGPFPVLQEGAFQLNVVGVVVVAHHDGRTSLAFNQVFRFCQDLMERMEPSEKKELIELLNKCWMTHDAMWFLCCLQECGIDKANKINKAAIRSLAPIETMRMRKFLGIEEGPVQTFEAFKKFFSGASELCVPDFMNVHMSFPRENVLHWEFEPKECFAYKGMQNIGVIEEYECGVIYRVGCWIESLKIGYDVNPKMTRCLMLDGPNCSGDFNLHF